VCVAKLPTYLVIALVGSDQIAEFTGLLPALIFEDLNAVHSEKFV
jgi:hypothetical protein